MEESPRNFDDPRLLLLLCQQIETGCAQVYREFARLSRTDTEACDLYSGMAVEEEEHAAEFELLFRIQNVTSVTIISEPRHIHDTHRWVEALVGKAAAATRLSVEESLASAVKTEKFLLGLHAGLVARIEDPEWRKLFGQLNTCDIYHLEKLKTFKRTRNLA